MYIGGIVTAVAVEISEVGEHMCILSHRPQGPIYVPQCVCVCVCAVEEIRQVASRRVTRDQTSAGPFGSTLQRVFCMPLVLSVHVYTHTLYACVRRARPAQTIAAVVNFAGCPRTWQSFEIGCKLLPRSTCCTTITA